MRLVNIVITEKSKVVITECSNDCPLLPRVIHSLTLPYTVLVLGMGPVIQGNYLQSSLVKISAGSLLSLQQAAQRS